MADMPPEVPTVLMQNDLRVYTSSKGHGKTLSHESFLTAELIRLKRLLRWKNVILLRLREENERLKGQRDAAQDELQKAFDRRA